jgi:formate C-acetyltransferase
MPCSAVSLLTYNCIGKGMPYLFGGPEYTVVSPHIGGAPDAGNSLYAIKKLVFDEQKVSFTKMIDILRNNWEGHENLRQYVRCKYTYYGNDNEESDGMVSRVLNDFSDLVQALNGRSPVLFPSGVSTFGRQLAWAPYRAAVPFGYKKGEILSGNASPTPGTDFSGATAIIKSYCKADQSKMASGSALDIKLFPAMAQGENGLTALMSLFRGFLELGGFFMQIDIMDKEILLQAKERPQDFKTLSVRVSGWNARFVTLDSKWQEMIIERSSQGE